MVRCWATILRWPTQRQTVIVLACPSQVVAVEVHWLTTHTLSRSSVVAVVTHVLDQDPRHPCPRRALHRSWETTSLSSPTRGLDLFIAVPWTDTPKGNGLTGGDGRLPYGREAHDGLAVQTARPHCGFMINFDIPSCHFLSINSQKMVLPMTRQ